MYACRFGNFLGNSAKEKKGRNIQAQTYSIWSFMLASTVRAFYVNSNYDGESAEKCKKEHKIQKLMVDTKKIVAFVPFIIRWDDQSLQPRTAFLLPFPMDTLEDDILPHDYKEDDQSAPKFNWSEMEDGHSTSYAYERKASG